MTAEQEKPRLKVYVILEGDSMQRFVEVKQYLGVKNDTDVFRFLVSWFWQHEVKATTQ